VNLLSKLSDIWTDPLYRFLLKAVFLFLLWYFVYELWLHPNTGIDMFVIRNLEDLSSWLLGLTGFQLIPDSDIDSIRTVGIDGTSGVWIGDPCNGLTLFSLFAGFVIAYPGSVMKKLWFIPLGLALIHALNVLRIAGLALILHYFPDPDILEFNHTYTFTLIVYGFVLYLWYLWAVKLSDVSMKKPA